jgi:ABC-2 type transport system permease protein
MSLKRTLILIKNEILHGPRGSILVMAVAMPIMLGLFVNLAFGNIFTDKAKLGVYDEDSSRIDAVLKSAPGIIYKTYDSESALESATLNGVVDMGLVLPTDFDATLRTGTIKLKAYIWGESLAKNRAILPAVLADAAHQVAGSIVPIDVETVTLGDPGALPWTDRLLPMVVLFAVFFGGLMVPAASLINEKQRHTLEALNVTPASLGDVFTAKGIIGAVLSVVMGTLSLIVSGGFAAAAWGQVLILVLGAAMSAEIGLMSGALVKDMNTLFALWKFGGLLLFGPALIYMFPQIPQWIGYVFPTFYVIKPMVDMSVSGRSFFNELLYVAILAALVAAGALVVAGIVRRLGTQALRMG